MAKPYDNDLRQKVIQAIEQDGLPKGEASKLFRISRNTIDLWFKRKAETGDIQPKKRDFSHAKQKISDLDAFRQFVEQHPDRTQAEMAELWDGTVSTRTISRRLAELNWSRKKRPMGIENEMKRGELHS
jgi:transposase